MPHKDNFLFDRLNVVSQLLVYLCGVIFVSFFELLLKTDLYYLWHSYGIATLVDEHNALFAYSLLSLQCLGNFHSITPFNASISNVARHLWLFEGMYLRMNPFKRGEDSMTWDAQGTVQLLQGPVTRAMARRIEEEHRGKIAKFEKMIQDLAWQFPFPNPKARRHRVDRTLPSENHWIDRNFKMPPDAESPGFPRWCIFLSSWPILG
ncbi:hypothetical protein M9H77_30095 [Catharanthus roseus]|uniref:Uncharacterized protein n=1 Tax=Catharanthus roseus TaxID=4058 RepID=A0ACB9ZYI2_CATRO|nr:hypothetical protein M9H77_30095 [Catharanthus roseus]